ncbi:MAG TPA: peptide chain release factor 1, partial [Sphaerochaeta sp.]|nr:peptide chain release factor 1 [Sphaerochaeta sp.]
MLKKLPEYEKQLAEIDDKLSRPETMQDMKLYKSLNQERSHLAPIIDQLRLMRSLNTQINEAHQLMKDETDQEMLEMTREELHELEKELVVCEQKTK